MDKRLEAALDFSNFRMILSTRQANLKTFMENKLLLPYEGGFFKITIELLSFIHSLIKQDVSEYILIDRNDIPILIRDLEEFYEQAVQKYDTAVKQYYESYQKLQDIREIRKVIDWDDKT